MVKYFPWLFLLLLVGCEEEDQETPIRKLISRAVVTNYRVDSMTDLGERCGWYVFEHVDRRGFDSIYMCADMKIGDTMRIHLTGDTVARGDTLYKSHTHY